MAFHWCNCGVEQGNINLCTRVWPSARQWSRSACREKLASSCASALRFDVKLGGPQLAPFQCGTSQIQRIKHIAYQRERTSHLLIHKWQDKIILESPFHCSYMKQTHTHTHIPISDPLRNSATPISVPIQRARMNGRLLPHRKVQRSLAEPIRGVNMRPRTGLRNHVKL